MEKIIKALLVLCAFFCVMPALACSQINEGATGGACSIKELNNLEKTTTIQRQINLQPKRERDLRPVKIGLDNPRKQCDKCVLGLCIQKTLLGE